MSGRTPGIPSLAGIAGSVRNVLGPIKETLEFIAGRRPGQRPIARLDPDKATAADCAVKLNEIIDRMTP